MIVDLCPYWTNPATGGGPERVFRLCTALSEIDNVKEISYRPTITMLGLRSTSMNNRRIVISQRYEEIQRLHAPSAVSSYLVPPDYLPPDFFIGKSASVLDGQVARTTIRNADFIQIEHPWLWSYAAKRKSRDTRLILSTHNCEYDLHRQTASRIGQCGFNLHIVRRAERHALDEADLVLAVSKQDIQSFDENLNIDIAHKAEVVPNGVDASMTTPASSDERMAAKKNLGIRSKKLAVFMGTRHIPNVEAVASILGIAGRHDRSQLRILVIGSAGEGFRDVHNVSFTGHVDDYREYLRAADIALNPLASGSGTSLKILEYFAAGIPVISTTAGTRGLEVEDGRHVLISETSALSESIDSLISDEDLAHRLSSNGRRLAVECYDWSSIGSKLRRGLKRRGFA